MNNIETDPPTGNGFFQTGGTLKADAPSYIERPADQELHQSLLAGDYCYVLTPRQMGKSSLMTKTAARLRGEGVHVAVVDLSGIGGDAGSMTADQWYYGLANRLLRELDIQLSLGGWWQSLAQSPPLSRLMDFFEDVILGQLQGQVVVFVDEIDTTIKLPFSDDFFAAIRACFNARANKAPFSRLSFVLLGVASPTELIRDAARTPFNIGKRIDLADFTEAEASLFLRGFGAPSPPAPDVVELSRHSGMDRRNPDCMDASKPRHPWSLGSGAPCRNDGETLDSTALNAGRLLKRILYWTGGHPFLTQRLCVQVQSVDSSSSPDEAKRNPGFADFSPRITPEAPSGLRLGVQAQAETPEAQVDRIVAAEFLGVGRRTQDEHLKVINDRITQTGAHRPALLKLYAKVLKGKPVQDQPQSPLHSALKLSGLVKTDGQGQLVVRNLIYRQVFDARWVRRLRPTRWKQNTVLGVVLASAIGFGWWTGAKQLTLRSGGSVVLASLGLPFPEPEMVEIPADSFSMGSPDTEKDRQPDESPQHKVVIAKPFRLGKYEVTFDEYDVFALLIKNDGGCTDGHEVTWAQDEGWGRGKRPVINVSWQDAQCYAEWLSRKTKKAYRLPTEAEWEYAARATTETPRPWPGELEAACRYANVFDQGSVGEIKKRYSYATWESFPCSDGYAFTAPVGKFKPNIFELHDMLGNVWEWVADCYHDTYQNAPVDGKSWDDGMKCASNRRVLRGGSWFYETQAVRSAYRYRGTPDFRNFTLGFRLAQD